MSHPAVRVEGLGKRYRIGEQEPYRALRDLLAQAMSAPVRALTARRRSGRPSNSQDNIVWALRNVSFEVQPGEILGLIGRNGAGKSTLLKILSRITEPTEGHAEIRGRVGSLLEVGTGFHPELTGRENIFLNGAILGMRRHEITRKFDEIVEFSGVEQFIDTPVKRYSSGMYLRLAFSVAAHLEPEVLVVDEVLAVGDAAFQKKCLGKMGEVAHSGRTVLLVSHNMEAITALCSRVIWLDVGLRHAEGEPEEVVRQYLTSGRERIDTNASLAQRTDRTGTGQIRLTGFRLQDAAGRPVSEVRLGEPADLVLSYATADGRGASHVTVWLLVMDQLRRRMLPLFSELTGQDFESVPPQGEFICRIPKWPLAPGRYSLDVGVATNGVFADRFQDLAFFDVSSGDFFGTGRPLPKGVQFLCEHSWKVEDTAGAREAVARP